MGRGLGRLLAAVACATSLGAHAIATQWTIVDLSAGGLGIATGISPNGTVVGCSLSGSQAQAFVYANGQARNLPAPAGSTSCALVVNDNGLIAGRIDGEVTIWDSGGAHGLGVQGNVTGINAAGAIVGSMNAPGVNPTGSSNTRAFMWANGVLTDLGVSGSAVGINVRNQVAVISGGRLYLWESGTLRDLNAAVVNAYGFNDAGQIVGMASFGHGPEAFVYDGSLHALAGSSVEGGAVAINNVGQALVSGEGVYGALVEGGTQATLSSLASSSGSPWSHLEGKAINDRGWIAGQESGGQGRAFLMMPKDSSTSSPSAAANPVARASAHSSPLIRMARKP